MAVSIRYEELRNEREKLLKRVDEINKTLDAFEQEVIKGKFNKAIKLLNECADYLYNGDIEIRCPECDERVTVSFDEMIEKLEAMGKDCGLH